MQADYEPYVALCRYSLNTMFATVTNYFNYAQQLRTLQLKTDKEMLAFANEANTEIEKASSFEAICALQQKFMTDLLGRELNYLREIEKLTRDASISSAAVLRNSKNPWQERMAQIAEGTSKFLADGQGPGQGRAASRSH